MNSYQLYDNKQLSLFASLDSSTSLPSLDKIQNCSVLEIQLQELADQSLDTRTLNPIFTFKDLEGNGKGGRLVESRDGGGDRRGVMIGKEYMNLKNWEERRRREGIAGEKEKDNAKQKANKLQRKRLLQHMLDKLNHNQKTMKQAEVDDSIIEKIQNIVGLLGEVEKEIKVKQKCSLGMKLKLKVDPNQRYFKRKDYGKEQGAYTSREKLYVKQIKEIEKDRSNPKYIEKYYHHDREQDRSRDLFKARKNIDFPQQPTISKQKSQYQHNQRQYGTQNLYSTSLSQKKTKTNHLQSHDKQRSVQHTTSLIKQKREEIVEKEMKRREKWYYRNGGK